MANDIDIKIGVSGGDDILKVAKLTQKLDRDVATLAKTFNKGNITNQAYFKGLNQQVSALTKQGVAYKRAQTYVFAQAKAVRDLDAKTDILTGSINQNTGAVLNNAKALGATKNKMNGNNMAIQQLGYQFGDFAVQVQGGTSAFVAFSQQGAQLAGILPMIAGPLGLSMGAAVGLSAALGILIPVGSAVARMFFEMKGKTDEATSSVKGLKAALETLEKFDFEPSLKGVGALEEKWSGALAVLREYYTTQASLKKTSLFEETDIGSQVKSALGELNALKSELSFQKAQSGAGPTEVQALDLAEATKSYESLKRVKDLLLTLDTSSTKALAESYNNVSKTLIAEELMTEELNSRLAVFAETAGIQGTIAKEASDLASSQKSTNADLQKQLGNLGKRANEWSRSMSKGYKQAQDFVVAQKKNNKAAQEQIRLQNQAINLQDIELKFGKDSAQYRKLAAGYELENLVIKLKEANVDEAHIKSLRSGNMALERGNQLLRDQLKITRLIFEGSAAAISMRKFAGRGTTSNKEISGDGIPKSKTKGGKSQAEIDAETIASFQKRIDLEQELLGKSEVRQKVIQALGKDLANSHDTSAMEAQIRETQELIDLEKQRKSLVDSVTGSVENGLMAMVDGTTSVKDAFKSMAYEIIKELYRVLVVQQMVNAAKMAFGFADGGVISGGSEVKAYANGGVVGSPTTFPMAGGKTGLMGEAGPEAIMPLKRGANGKLGVQAEGGSGDIYVTNNYSISANTSEDTKRLVTQTIQQAQPALTQAAKASIMNDRRRGGQMKSVFG